jgi:hypothetical protein
MSPPGANPGTRTEVSLGARGPIPSIQRAHPPPSRPKRYTHIHAVGRHPHTTSLHPQKLSTTTNRSTAPTGTSKQQRGPATTEAHRCLGLRECSHLKPMVFTAPCSPNGARRCRAAPFLANADTGAPTACQPACYTMFSEMVTTWVGMGITKLETVLSVPCPETPAYVPVPSVIAHEPLPRTAAGLLKSVNLL